MKPIFFIVFFMLIGLAFAPISPSHAQTLNIDVTACDFTGAGSISEAIASANADAIGANIAYTLPCTTTFTTARTINRIVNISNNGHTVIWDGGGTSRFFVVSNTRTLNLSGITLRNGRAVEGGAIDNAGTLIISNSTFHNNSSISSGGALLNRSTGNTTISNSTFHNNSSGNGGVILISGSVSIQNSTFYNNNATSIGGAFINNGGILTVTHSTLANHTSITGWMLQHMSGTTTITHSIISGGGTQCSGTGFSANATNMTDNTCGAATIVTDLALGAFNGQVIPLTNTSPALDFYSAPCALSADQLGVSRPQRDSCDVGAYEAPHINLNATSVCIGTDLHVSILAGDEPFQITSSAGTHLTGIGLGAHIIPNFGSQTGVNVTELAGDTENYPLGDVDCSANTLSASAICVGADLHITIGNGEAPFQITSNAGTHLTGIGLGTHIIPNFGLQTGVNVTELAGDTENYPLGDMDCSVTIISPPPTSVQLLVLGCVFDAPTGVEIAHAPDNTYCRVLMRDGAVTDFSGAIPADLIALGVILAVDVYRLEGGMSINTFPVYARICLTGEGRYFYLDGRDAPRYAIEMPIERLDGQNCAWIPAPGTVVLTRR